MASVQERPRKNTKSAWAVLFRHGKRQSSRSFETEKAAHRFKAMVDQFGPERALAYLADESDDRPAGITLDVLAEKWLASKKADVTPRIHTGYERDYNRWIKDRLGHREAALINEADVQAWVDWMRLRPSPATGKPLSPKSIADRHAILHGIFSWGAHHSRKLVPGNPCKETELPRRRKSNPKGLRIPELHALLEAGERVDRDAADLIAFMAGTGWRISEAVALTSGSVEDDGRRIYVNMERVLRRQVGIVEDGKSHAAFRRLRVIGPAEAMLRRRLVGLGPDDLVFTFADGRPGVNRRGPWNINSFRDLRWPRIVAAAGLADRKPTPHWLRHTHVLLCHTAGMSLAEIQRRIGHEDIKTTINIYGRMIDDVTDDAADKLGALLAPSQPRVIEGKVMDRLDLPDGS